MFLGIGSILNQSGVCISEMRRYSDAEIVELAKERAFYDYSATAKSPAAEQRLGKNYITYATKDDFIQKNQNCCKVLTPSEPEWRPELEVTGFVTVEGRFRAWVQLLMDAGNGFTKKGLEVVDNCGNFRVSLY